MLFSFLLDKIKINQLESSYQEIQEKYIYLEQIKSKYELLKEDFDKTKLQLQDQKDKYQHDVTNLQNDVKHKNQLSDLLETQINENKNLKAINKKLESDLEENDQLLFDKTKEADDLNRQLQILNNEYQDLKITIGQRTDEKNKFTNDINLLHEKLRTLEKERSEQIQVERLLVCFNFKQLFLFYK